MQRISVNLTNYFDENQLNYNNDLPAIGNKNYALKKPFVTDFLTVIGNAKHILLCKITRNIYFIVKFIKLCSPTFTSIFGSIY